MNKIKIGLLGLGNVGIGAIKILKENYDHIYQKTGVEIEVKKILVRDLYKERDVTIDKTLLTLDPYEILNDTEISIVIELIGGEEPALTYIKKAIENKKHVISANKLCIAENMEEIFKLVRENEVMFKYEGSVAGGIPIIQGINGSLAANKIESIIGIINGTTNFILSKMTNEDKAFDEVLKEAQDLGYAEADPTSDIENFDARYKLKILSKLAFGYLPKDIYTEGITKIEKEDIAYAKELGYIFKSLALGRVKDDKLELRVTPCMIKKKHPLANVSDSFNALLIKGNAVDELMFYGRGAGSLPTGSAVVSDLITVVSNMAKNQIDIYEEYSTVYTNSLVQLDKAESESKFYLRLKVVNEEGVLAFITGCMAELGISIKSIIQKEVNDEDVCQLVIFVNKIKYGQMDNLLNQLENSKKVVDILNVFSVL
ncbi:MAG: homoserine dehydrogenase [Lachnospirales bacterium]